MDAREEIGYLVHNLCGEPAFVLDRKPKTNKVLVEYIRCDINGHPVFPGEIHCPNCNGVVKLTPKDISVQLYERPLNGSSVMG